MCHLGRQLTGGIPASCLSTRDKTFNERPLCRVGPHDVVSQTFV
jgi:hypothetical protein